MYGKGEQKTVENIDYSKFVGKRILLAEDNDLNAEIAVEIQHPYQETTHETRSFWQRLIQVESVKQPSALLMQRSVILKEAQLRLLTAQSALQSGQPLVFTKAIDSVIEVLKQLPDQKTKTWMNQLIRIKAIPATPLPMLNTRTLIGE